MNALSKLSISDLTVEERLELIEALWDSLEEEVVDLSPAERAELDRRLDDIDAGHSDTLRWEDYRAGLKARYS